MELNSEYMVSCPPEDEKKLVAELNALFDDRIRKTTSKGMLGMEKPFVFKYFYWGMRKEDGLYIGLQANTDEEGKVQIPKHASYQWVLRTRVNPEYTIANGNDPKKVAASAEEKIRKMSFPTKFVQHQD